MPIKEEKLSCIEVDSKQDARYSIIWLHGLGADGQDFVPMIPELKLEASNVRFIFPNAPFIPITINNGYIMRGWYDIYALHENGRVDTPGILHSISGINELIQQEIARGIPSERIILGGFSQGALIALVTGLLCEQRLGGILGLSGYLPQADTLLQSAHSANHKTPIFIGHGQEDNIVPYAFGQMAVKYLQEKGYQVLFKSYAIAHSVCETEFADMSQWLKLNCLKG